MTNWLSAPKWANTGPLGSLNYVCGHCGNAIASNVGYHSTSAASGHGRISGKIYLCHSCSCPTFFDELKAQFPSPSFGPDVSDIPDADVAEMYRQARDSMKTNSYAASVLCCRKLLMHIAVAQGAPKDQKFVQYVDFFSTEGHVPKNAKGWITHIKDKGNEENHQIILATKEDAQRLIEFSSMLLQILYSFPAKVPKAKDPDVKPPDKPAVPKPRPAPKIG